MSRLAEQTLVPGYAQLSTRVEALTVAVETLCTTPGDAARSTAHEQWRAAALQLRRLSALPVGPVLDSRVLRYVDFWPTRPAQIESAIVGRAAGSLPPERVGATAKGLPALEYLLFSADRPPIEGDPAACAYAVWVANDAAARLQVLVLAWPVWLVSLQEAEAEEEARLLSDGVNTLIGSVDGLRVKYIEKPARSSAPAPFDAWRSGGARAHLLAFFVGVRVGLQGSDGVPGLTALMRGRGMLELAARLDARIESAAAALQALPDDPAADAAALANAIDALARLQALLARDVAEKLKVWVGFGESDGD